jgi:hypothetical protein
MNDATPLFVIGDIHGHLDKMMRLLRYAGLATSQAEWLGGGAQLWFMGDFADRGPDGIGVIEYVMRLQENAAARGGHVGAILGNHDVGILTAKLFPNAPSRGAAGTFYGDWVANGGTVADLARLQPAHMDWLRRLPAMAIVNNRLLIHADALFYLNYGDTLDQVNATIAELLQSTATEHWDVFLGYAGERLKFDERQTGGVMRAAQMLAYFGGRQIIHGHTPIDMLNGEPLNRITRAYAYGNGLVIDTDGGIYKGGTGFVYEAPPLDMSVLNNISAEMH